MDNTPMPILSGIRVLSFTQFLLGPAGVQYLADLGADVIKIEPPGKGAWERTWAGGDTFKNGVSLFYLLAHRNVRSVTLNLKAQGAQDVVRRLVAGADVLVQNFRPGVVERFGLGYEQVRQIRPDIIYASASGYGENSPYRDLPGQDLLLQAVTGLTWLNGQSGQPPTPVGAAIVDQHGASLLAMGILAALFHRERTGEGQKIEVTMLQSAFDLQTEPLVYYLNGGHVQRPSQPLGSSFHPAPYGLYETCDGYLALSLSPMSTVREALGGPEELAPYEDPKLATSQPDAIYEALAPFLKTRTTAELIDVFRSHGVWCAPVHDYDAALEDPAVQYADPLLPIDHPEAGRVQLLKHPVSYSAAEPSVQRLPPSLGEHTDEVLQQMGYSPDEIRQLRDVGAV